MSLIRCMMSVIFKNMVGSLCFQSLAVQYLLNY